MSQSLLWPRYLWPCSNPSQHFPLSLPQEVLAAGWSFLEAPFSRLNFSSLDYGVQGLIQIFFGWLRDNISFQPH